MNESPSAELTRSHKRRRVIRRRISNDSQETPIGASTTCLDQDAAAIIGQNERVERPRVPRRHGLAFSNNNRQTQQPPSTELSLAVLPVARNDDRATPDRFVKATGRALVTEDRHMSAFIDAKLAELRSSTIEQPRDGSAAQLSDDIGVSDPTMVEAVRDEDGKPILQAIPLQNDRHRRKHRRRQITAPSETDIARDGLVDRIMRDGALPIYENSPLAVASTDSHDDNNNNEVAAIAAFKAEFLASMEEEKKFARKAATGSAAPSGPKLGGSRMARERMKALEEQTKTAARTDQR